MWLYFRLFLLALRLLQRDRRDLVLENLALRQQLAAFERRGRTGAPSRRGWSRARGAAPPRPLRPARSWPASPPTDASPERTTQGGSERRRRDDLDHFLAKPRSVCHAGESVFPLGNMLAQGEVARF